MREEFSLSEDIVYLNSANLSLCPRSVIEAMHQYHLEFEKNPTMGLAEAWEMLWGIQNELALFLHASPQDLFLRSNVTATLNTFLLGMPLPKNSEILVGELEYGAIVNICRMRAERDGLKLRIVKMPISPVALKQLSASDLIESITSQISPSTSLLLLSHVTAGNGVVLPIEEIAKYTRARGVLLAVDGAYAPGAIPVDFSQLSQIDFYGCSLYKWMMGPKGTSFGWVHPMHQMQMQPINAGWTTYDIRGPIGNFADGSRFQSMMLMAGCYDFAPFFAIREMLNFWRRHSPERIRSRMRELRDHLHLTVDAQLNWVLLSPGDSRLVGPMCLYELPDSLQSEGPTLMTRLLHELGLQINLVCLRGKWYAIFSPHVYNTENEITKAITKLAKFAALF